MASPRDRFGDDRHALAVWILTMLNLHKRRPTPPAHTMFSLGD